MGQIQHKVPSNVPLSIICVSVGTPLCTALEMIAPHMCVDQIVTNWHLYPQVVGANPRSVPNPVCWAELPPRSLGCHWGHPCRQRVMKQGGELCCGFYFISDTRGGRGADRGRLRANHLGLSLCKHLQTQWPGGTQTSFARNSECRGTTRTGFRSSTFCSTFPSSPLGSGRVARNGIAVNGGEG